MTPKERQILFSAPMVRAILDGLKTQTRRIVKPQPQLGEYAADGYMGEPWWAWIKNPDSNTREVAHYWKDGTPALFEGECPYGNPGDRLWVRETFAHWNARELFGAGTMPTTAFRAGRPVLRPPPGGPAPFERWTRGWSEDTKPKAMKWTPSIYMPRWASRITLEITDVRVERLQSMEGQHESESDALAEGVKAIHHGDGDYYYSAFRSEPDGKNWTTPERAFRELWESINGPDSWSVNPWVWVLTFQPVEQTRG